MRLVIGADALISAYTNASAIHEDWRKGSGEHEYVISPEIFQEAERALRQSLSDVDVRKALIEILNRCRLERVNSHDER